MFNGLKMEEDYSRAQIIHFLDIPIKIKKASKFSDEHVPELTVSDEIDGDQGEAEVGKEPQMKVVQVDVIRIDVHLFHVQRLDFEKQENVEDQERDVGDNNKIVSQRFLVDHSTPGLGSWLGSLPLVYRYSDIDDQVNNNQTNTSN